MKTNKIKRIYIKFTKKIERALNNVSLKNKFLIMFFVCVIFPVALSSLIFSISANNYFYEREMTAVQRTTQTVSSQIQSIVDDAVIMANAIASDRTIRDISKRDFSNQIEYYDYIIDNGLKNFYETYLAQKSHVRNISVYLYNGTVSNGGVIWKIDESVRQKFWYQQCVGMESSTMVCTDDYVSSTSAQGGKSETFTTVSVIRTLSEDLSGRNSLGYVKIDLNMDNLRTQLLRNSDYIDFYLLDTEADIVYYPEQNLFIYGIDAFKAEMAEKGRVLTETGFGNIQYLSDWKLYGAFDRESVFEKQVANTIIIILIALAVGLLMMATVILIYRSYNKRIIRLVESMRRVESGDFKSLSYDFGTDELGRLANSYNHMIDSINSLINDVYKLEIKNKSIEAEKAKAELKYLQSQIDPHFIFNVLNAMLVVSVKNGYTELTEQLRGFSKMFRRLLDWSEDYEPLSTEISFIEIYLNLEKFRFKDQFQYELDIDGNTADCKVPKMIIQPIVENACRHGLHEIVGVRKLYLSARMEDDVLYVLVRDNGKGMSKKKLAEITASLDEEDFSGHIGVKNVYRRLKYYFDNRADMTITSEEGTGTEVLVTINYKE